MTTVAIDELSLFGCWHRELTHDTCGICKNSLNEQAPLVTAADGTVEHFAEEASGHGLLVGGCGHVFHSHCLVRWLERRAVCPLCNAAWTTQRRCE
jgi:RING-box protein 1